MLYYFLYKSFPANLKAKPREYYIGRDYSMVRVEIGRESYLTYYFEEWDEWDADFPH